MSLIEPVRGESICKALASVEEAHAFVAERAMQVVSSAGIAVFGRQSKRMTVDLSGSPSQLVGEDDHPLTEVINQCATVERLLFVMRWICDEHSDAVVEVAHPTTSYKGPTAPDDALDQAVVSEHDLVVRYGGTRRCFEVSDVASRTDGNGKLEKDLISLGFLRVQTDLERLLSGPGASVEPESESAEKFVVVSGEWFKRLAKIRSTDLTVLRLAGVRLEPWGPSLDSGGGDIDPILTTGVFKVVRVT